MTIYRQKEVIKGHCGRILLRFNYKLIKRKHTMKIEKKTIKNVNPGH